MLLIVNKKYLESGVCGQYGVVRLDHGLKNRAIGKMLGKGRKYLIFYNSYKLHPFWAGLNYTHLHCHRILS